jgi:hypothetical protein
MGHASMFDLDVMGHASIDDLNVGGSASMSFLDVMGHASMFDLDVMGHASIDDLNVGGSASAEQQPTEARHLTRKDYVDAGDLTNANSIATNTAAIANNTAKTGITSAQASEITANTAKVGQASGTTTGDMQYWNGTAWVVVAAGVAGQELTMNSGATAPEWVTPNSTVSTLAIGQEWQGGIIFYLDASGKHGLISAPTDQSAGIQWYNGSFVDTYAYGNGIGAGEGNSQGIRRWQGYCSSCYASELCQNLSLGGETDWYLPSKYELNLMFENIGQGNALGLGNIGNFANNFYWSSTEYDFGNAWFQNFYFGDQNFFDKNFTIYVRAVRAF